MPRDAGRDGEVGALEEKEAVLECEKGLLEKLDGSTREVE